MVRWMSGLVNGLQNRVHPFESGTHLQQKGSTKVEPFFIFFTRYEILRFSQGEV